MLTQANISKKTIAAIWTFASTSWGKVIQRRMAA